MYLNSAQTYASIIYPNICLKSMAIMFEDKGNLEQNLNPYSDPPSHN